MSEWEPIETAPNDGSEILLLFKSENKISVGYWDAYYAKGGNGYEGGLGWIEPISGEQLDLHYYLPIAWMPLPPPK